MLFVLSIACSDQEKLKVYTCEDAKNANRCSDGCVLVKNNMRYSFLVNKDAKSVLQIVYYNGEQIGAITNKDCTIFSDNNWDCSTSNTYQHVTESNEKKMINGVFTDYTEVRDRSDYSLRNKEDKGICAK